jgi:hypothetical protein
MESSLSEFWSRSSDSNSGDYFAPLDDRFQADVVDRPPRCWSSQQGKSGQAVPLSSEQVLKRSDVKDWKEQVRQMSAKAAPREIVRQDFAAAAIR